MQQSYLQFVLSALGPLGALLLSVSTLVALAIIAGMLIRGRGTWAVGAMLLAIPLPLFVGLYAFTSSSLNSFVVISQSGAEPTAAQWADGVATALVGINLGMLLSGTLLVISLIGLTVRALTESTTGPRHMEFVPPHAPTRAAMKAV